MKEIELKAHASLSIKEDIDKFVGTKGQRVIKNDQYFRRPGEVVQALRVRENNEILEITAKKQNSGEETENNLEFELFLTLDQKKEAYDFFECLGFEKYFLKHKEGYSWFYDGLHIELFDVNNIGGFIEIEALLDYDAEDAEVEKAREKIKKVLKHFNLLENVERKSYREMILSAI